MTKSLLVIDENVLDVADGLADHVGDTCRDKCIALLLACQQAENLVVDAAREVLSRYATPARFGGETPGAAFFIWAFQNVGRHTEVEVAQDAEGLFEVPEACLPFDEDDRIWIACAHEAGPDARIVNAVDSDYSHASDRLSGCGISVSELCPDDLKEE